MSSEKQAIAEPGNFPPHRDDEENLILEVDWSPEEERRAKRGLLRDLRAGGRET